MLALKKINVDTVVFASLSPRAMLFSSDAGTWAQTIPSSVCVSCVSGSVHFIAYGGMKSFQSQKARGAPLYPDGNSSSMSYPQPFDHLRPAWCVCDACMCDSSQLVARSHSDLHPA